MKKVIYLFFALGMLIVIGSCKKNGGNPLANVNSLGTGAYLLLDNPINLNLDFSNLATSKVGIQVTAAPGGQAVQSIVLFVSKTTTYDTTQWSRIKTVPYAGAKTALTVTGTELAAALKVSLTDLTPGSNYVFFTRVITKSGQYFDASNTGNDAGTGLVTGATYNSAFSFTAYIVCPFVGPVAGNYMVKRDDWADWSQGNVVQVTDGPKANEINLSQVYPNPDAGDIVNPLVVDVDPATGTATVKQVTFGNYGGNVNYIATGNGTNGVAGYVFSCTGYITLTMHFTDSQGGDYGPITLILQKQ